jgi:methionine-S-sulfoxide reductase
MKNITSLMALCILAGSPILLGACQEQMDEGAASRSREVKPNESGSEKSMSKNSSGESKSGPAGNTGAPGNEELATFGAGCFWCVEAVLEQLDGVKNVASGYMGGRVENPTYEQVCSNTTGHAEVVQVTFDPERISYEKLLEYFWKLHDPTTLNRQGNDVGTQYRSVIFYHSESQREAAERSKKAMDASGTFGSPIVTEITKASTFYPAEKYHQDYYRLNKQKPYCQYVITPKLKKLGMEY